MKIGFLHPGKMGVSLAANTMKAGHEAFWLSEGRSEETRVRAKENNLIEIKTIEDFCKTCEIIISVCPPEFAQEVATQVASCSFTGVYADVNAISPERTILIGEIISSAGAEFVDGGIIGGPVWQAGTILYLSGASSHKIADCFSEGFLETKILGEEIGKASALKMCFAANSKGTTALLTATLATADKLGVRQELEDHWSLYSSDFVKRTHRRIQVGAQKAWRFSGEMREIADTFELAGIPNGIYLTASEVYHLIREFKGREELPEIEEILDSLKGSAHEED